MTLWLSDEITDNWYYQGKRKPGGILFYRDSSVLFSLTLRALYGLGYRQTQGFISGLFALGNLALTVPSYSQLQRRSKDLVVDVRIKKNSGQKLDIVLDSTGLKVYGEGEWKVRKHGVSKRRTWRKLHIGSKGNDLEIVSVVISGNELDDAQAGIEIIKQLEEPIKSCAADGAYDKKKFRGCLPIETIQLIPPQRNAVVSKGKDKGLKQRDEAIKRIAQVGRDQWKKETGYHKRSLSEVNMYRYKTIFGPNLKAREPAYEQTEVKVKCRILNQFVAMGMPKSYKVKAAV